MATFGGVVTAIALAAVVAVVLADARVGNGFALTLAVGEVTLNVTKGERP